MEPFTSSMKELLVGEKKFIVRILKMNGSTMLFISHAEPEILDEMAVGMVCDQKDSAAPKAITTTIFGAHVLTDSQHLAEKLSKRYKRQFFVSNSTNVDRLLGPQLEKQLCDFLNSNEALIV